MGKDFNLRNMTRKELDVAVGWAAEEGWNPGLHDADVFWQTDSEGFIALDRDGEMIGSVSGVSYNGEYGFGGFFIIKPEFRKHGLGTRLANHFINKLSSRLKKGAAIGIDGVFNMQPTYAKWGFKYSHRNLRMEGVAVNKNYDSGVSQILSEDFEQMSGYDKVHFGVDRRTFLKGWLEMKDSRSLKYVEDKKIKGYGVIRKCVKGFKVGPLFAQNYKVADELFKALSSFANGDTIYLDIPETNKDALKLAENYNMKQCFGCARMYLGKAPKLPYNQIYGVTTFELG